MKDGDQPLKFTELLGNTEIAYNDVEMFASNQAAPADNWHRRDDFESLPGFQEHHYMYGLCIALDRGDTLWLLVDDGRKEGAVWFPATPSHYLAEQS